MKQIWLGPILGNNRARLIERCAALVSKGEADSFLYLTASHPLLELVTEGILDGSTNRGLWGELPVYLFRGFVRRVVRTAVTSVDRVPLPIQIPIDGEDLPLKRSLISQILMRLKAQGKLNAIGPLASSEGCVNTVAKLLGELERAAKTAAELREIVESRSLDGQTLPTANVPLQIDFDREIVLIYEAYERALSAAGLTEADADQLRALGILRGQCEGKSVTAPWLQRVKLLVLDGFFDFTPVQGEMLRVLIPQVSEVIVNLNHDERNPEIFRAFHETVAQLASMDAFEVMHFNVADEVPGALAPLRQRLFNPEEKREVRTPNTENRIQEPLPKTQYSESPKSKVQSAKSEDREQRSELRDQELEELETRNSKLETRSGTQYSALSTSSETRFWECTDRETEIRAIAKEIKRLIFFDSYKLSDIALVVRERESYADMIARVLSEESIPCSLERPVETLEIPGVRAARKLFQLLAELEDENASIRVSILADLIKSEYFSLSKKDLEALTQEFDLSHSLLLWLDTEETSGAGERLRYRLGIGRWDVDALENVIAYVGGELRVSRWLDRAGQLLNRWPQVKDTSKLAAPDPNSEQDGDDDPEDQIVDADKIETDARDTEKKRRPSRDVHPAAIAWTALVIRRIAESIRNVPREGAPVELRLGVLRLLEQLQFSSQIRKPLRRGFDEHELPQAMLDLRGLEALRRSFVATIKAFEIAEIALTANSSSGGVRLAAFLNEVSRCLGSQSQEGAGAHYGGLRVLAATDVRGLRFRAVFIAGLVEGGFPLRASRDWIYPHEERARLKEFGLTLEDISPATLLKEEHYFYQAACRATERLYLLRPMLLEDGSETVASYYIEELRRAIAPVELHAETMRRDFDGKQAFSASTPAELSRSLIRQQQRRIYGDPADEAFPISDVEPLLSWAADAHFVSQSALARIAIERERWSRTFGPYDGLITQPSLRSMLASHFGADFPHSASGLSLYGNCAYRFFASRVLKLEPRGEAALDLQALDAGKLLHDVLRQFFERHRNERLQRDQLPKLRRELAELADQVFDEHERVVPPLNPKVWKIDREIRKILLDQVLLFELGVQEKTKLDMRPAHFEVAFGMKPHQPADPISRVEHLELTRTANGGEESIKIQGQIDRVDVADENILVAYDYKLSKGNTSFDMVAGRTLQVPIYLEALERLILPQHTIAGGGYYTVRGGSERRNRGIYRAAFGDYTGINARTSSVLGDREWQQIRADAIARIWEFLDGMRAGDFRLIPSEGKKTCKFCDFAAVCRYSRYRIQRKVLNSGL